MASNAWEWCADWYDSDYYSKSPLRNPQGPSSGNRRVLRGGSWINPPYDLRAASRGRSTPTNSNGDVGFRCVSGSVTTGPFTSDGVAPLPLSGNQGAIQWAKDGSEMALIPAGSFEMGDHLDGMTTALPVHRVELDAFYMDVNEVTVGQFKQFVEESGYAYNRGQDVTKYSPGDDYPMVYVSWHDATAYCEWAGKRLPTEAEWEYAARGGLIGNRYPWGNDEGQAREYANYNSIGGRDKWGLCAPVGSFAANGYGLYDMAGNVWEWCSDRFGGGYYATSPVKNPTGTDTGQPRVLRGVSWVSSPFILRAANRNNVNPSSTSLSNGFRCVSGF